MKDPEIRLFGRKITLPDDGKVLPLTVSSAEDSGEACCAALEDEISSGSALNRGMEEDLADKVEEVEEKAEEGDRDEEMRGADEDCLEVEAGSSEKDKTSVAEDSDNNPNALSASGGNSKTTLDRDESETGEPSKDEKDQADARNSQQKTLRKPDKILPCPRCDSMDTKFCYYNNYNVNQPRHFCKSCQRYWTAGGTMRNVPVGAGRRKSKSSSSNCRHVTLSEALQAAEIDVPNGYIDPSCNAKGTVLSFGPDSPLFESMSSVSKIADTKAPNGTVNGYYKNGVSNPSSSGENGDDSSNGSTVTTSGSMADGAKNVTQQLMMQNNYGFPSPIPCLPGVPWPFPWNPAVPMPAICPSGFPMPFYPTPYWNCRVPGPWNIPWLPPASPPANKKPSGSGPNSRTLGKHSRDGELIHPTTPEGNESSEEKKSGGSVLVPKTLRIDDPDEAAKSSIWKTLGIKYDSKNKGGIFNAFESKAEEKNKHPPSPSPVLQANPAALSRSLSFQETA